MKGTMQSFILLVINKVNIVICILFVITACSKEEPIQFTIDKQYNQTMSKYGGSIEVLVTSATTWSVSSDSDWITLDLANSSGNNSVTITCSQNIGMSRSGIISFNDGNSVISIKITQQEERGNGTEKSPYLIWNETMLKEVAQDVNEGDNKKGIYYKIINDINLECNKDNQWVPIGCDGSNGFNGCFDGGDFKITEIYIDGSVSKIGLFGSLGENAKIENLTISGMISSIVNNENFGGLEVGSIAAENNGKIANCNNMCIIIGQVYVGGLVGKNRGEINNCHNFGEIQGGEVIGGVIGLNTTGIITSCSNKGNLVGDTYIGGITGWNICSGDNENSGIISNCYNTGNVTATNEVVGGIVGDEGGKISSCYNTGNIKGDFRVGGIVGVSISGKEISNCYNIGIIEGYTQRVGGIVGDNFSAKILNCYNIGEVKSETKFNGIIGWVNSGTITNCYSLVGQGENGGSVKTYNEMKSLDLVNDLNSTNSILWKQDFIPNINSGYPILTWQEAQ